MVFCLVLRSFSRTAMAIIYKEIGKKWQINFVRIQLIKIKATASASEIRGAMFY